MESVKIKISDKEFPVGYAFLRCFSGKIPHGKEYIPLAKEIINTNNPSLIYNVLSNSQTRLDLPEMDRLWDTGNLSVWRILANESSFLANITNSQIQDVICSDDPKLLVTIANNIHHMLQPKQLHTHIGTRSSLNMRCDLVNHIKTSKFEDVKKALMWNKMLPKNFQPKFKDFMEYGFYDFPSHVIGTITGADLEYLRHFDIHQLINFYLCLPDVEDIRIRNKAYEYLRKCRDPEIRYQLVTRINDLPKEIQDILRNDSDMDIRNMVSNKN